MIIAKNFKKKEWMKIAKIKKKLRSGSDEIRTRDPLVVSEISYPQTTEPYYIINIVNILFKTFDGKDFNKKNYFPNFKELAKNEQNLKTSNKKSF